VHVARRQYEPHDPHELLHMMALKDKALLAPRPAESVVSGLSSTTKLEHKRTELADSLNSLGATMASWALEPAGTFSQQWPSAASNHSLGGGGEGGYGRAAAAGGDGVESRLLSSYAGLQSYESYGKSELDTGIPPPPDSMPPLRTNMLDDDSADLELHASEVVDGDKSAPRDAGRGFAPLAPERRRPAPAEGALPVMVRIEGEADIQQGALRVGPATPVAQTLSSVALLVDSLVRASSQAHLYAAEADLWPLVQQCGILDEFGQSVSFEELSASRNGPEVIHAAAAVAVLVSRPTVAMQQGGPMASSTWAGGEELDMDMDESLSAPPRPLPAMDMDDD